MADPVDAPILEEQGAGTEPRPDLGRRNARREQSPARHHAVPNPGQLGDYRLYRPGLVSHDTPRQDGAAIRPGTLRRPTAPWRSGYAAACKAVYTGSIPVGALDDDCRSRHSEARTPVARIAAMTGSLISGPILPTNSAAASFAPMKISSAASAVLR